MANHGSYKPLDWFLFTLFSPVIMPLILYVAIQHHWQQRRETALSSQEGTK